ncbi:MAG TPA: hypothetical protein VNX25_04330 [Verrucomicrobiae bacterium]|nr:hypothetical protein [Verrucomicrobiae bacterium]
MKNLLATTLLILSCMLGACGNSDRHDEVVATGDTVTANVQESIIIRDPNIDKATIVVASAATGEPFAAGTDFVVTGVDGKTTAIRIVPGGAIVNGQILVVTFAEVPEAP